MLRAIFFIHFYDFRELSLIKIKLDDSFLSVLKFNFTSYLTRKFIIFISIFFGIFLTFENYNFLIIYQSKREKNMGYENNYYQQRMNSYPFQNGMMTAGLKGRPVSSIEEAQKCIEEYEKNDKRDGIYEPNYYDIVNEEQVPLVD